MANVNPDVPDFGSETRFATTFLGGVKGYVSERIGVRADARFMMIFLGGGGGFWCGNGGCGTSIGGYGTLQGSFNGGLFIAF